MATDISSDCLISVVAHYILRVILFHSVEIAQFLKSQDQTCGLLIHPLLVTHPSSNQYQIWDAGIIKPLAVQLLAALFA